VLDLDTGDIWGLVTEVHAIKPKIIIVLGYAEFARDLLEELKERLSVDRHRVSHLSATSAPISQGCKSPLYSPEISPLFGADNRLTGSYVSGQKSACGTFGQIGTEKRPCVHERSSSQLVG
jgi:hypothetical protein